MAGAGFPNNAWSQAVLALGPFWYFPLDETGGFTAFDHSGNGHDAPFTNSGGASVLGVTGLVPTSSGTAYLGMGKAPEIASLAYTFNTVTFMCWIQTVQANGDIVLVEVNESAAGIHIYAQFRLESGQVFLQMDDSVPNIHFVQGGPDLRDGKRHFVCATYDGAALIAYVDGFQVASTAAVFTPWTGPRLTGLGWSQNFVSGTLYSGTIDEMVCYDYALTAAQIEGLWTKATVA